VNCPVMWMRTEHSPPRVASMFVVSQLAVIERARREGVGRGRVAGRTGTEGMRRIVSRDASRDGSGSMGTAVVIFVVVVLGAAVVVVADFGLSAAEKSFLKNFRRCFLEDLLGRPHKGHERVWHRS
jgi:hypothetical protein